MPKSPIKDREGDNQKILIELGEFVKITPYGQATLKFQDGYIEVCELTRKVRPSEL